MRWASTRPRMATAITITAITDTVTATSNAARRASRAAAAGGVAAAADVAGLAGVASGRLQLLRGAGSGHRRRPRRQRSPGARLAARSAAFGARAQRARAAGQGARCMAPPRCVTHRRAAGLVREHAREQRVAPAERADGPLADRLAAPARCRGPAPGHARRADTGAELAAR